MNNLGSIIQIKFGVLLNPTPGTHPNKTRYARHKEIRHRKNGRQTNSILRELKITLDCVHVIPDNRNKVL